MKAFAINKLPPLQIGSPWQLTSVDVIFRARHKLAGDITLKQSVEKLGFSLFWMGSNEKSTLRKICKKSDHIRCFIAYMYSIPPNGLRIDLFMDKIICRLNHTIYTLRIVRGLILRGES